MRHTTVRVSTATRDLLRRLADRERAPMQAVLERAIEEYRRRHFLEEVNRAYASLRSDERAWADLVDERGAWDVTLGDGLVAESVAGGGPRAPGRRRGRR